MVNKEIQSTRMNPIQVIAAAVMFVCAWRSVFFRTLIVPIALYTGVSLLSFSYRSGWVLALLLVVFLVAHTVIAVTTHRLVLLGEDSIPRRGLRSWSRRETTFLIYFFLTLLCAVPAAVLVMVPFIGGLLSLVCVLWILSRLSLVFPSIAVGDVLTIREAWTLSSGYQWLLISVVGVFPFLVGMAFDVLNRIPMISMFTAVADSVVTIFAIAALSIVYREVRRDEGSD